MQSAKCSPYLAQIPRCANLLYAAAAVAAADNDDDNDNDDNEQIFLLQMKKLAVDS